MSYKGKFSPKNPSKYDGDLTKITFRSSWELRFMDWLDKHEDVISWSSESIAIPYLSPIDGDWHRYYPDFKVKQRNKNGGVEVLIIEIKPEKETIEPEVRAKKTKRYIKEVYTWGVNSAKWKAAEKYCATNKAKFMILTEKNLGINY